MAGTDNVPETVFNVVSEYNIRLKWLGIVTLKNQGETNISCVTMSNQRTVRSEWRNDELYGSEEAESTAENRGELC